MVYLFIIQILYINYSSRTIYKNQNWLPGFLNKTNLVLCTLVIDMVKLKRKVTVAGNGYCNHYEVNK